LNLAKHLAPAYKLEAWIEVSISYRSRCLIPPFRSSLRVLILPCLQAMCTARPEVGVAYRKSQRSQRAAEEATKPNVAVANPPAVPAPTSTAPVASPASNRTNGAPLAPPIATPASQTSSSTTSPAFTRVPITNSRGATGTPSRAAKRSRVSQESPAATASNAVDRMETYAPAIASSADHVTVTLQSTHELHAPINTSPSDLSAAAEAEIAASKADVLRLREEALARSAAGESALEMGLVAAQPGISGGPGANLTAAGNGGVRGIKRTTEEVSIEDENVSIPAGAAEAVTALKNSGEGRVIAGNRRIVNNEVAARRQNVWGGVVLAAGLAASYFASNFLL
jgi:hypothetical protein